MIPSRERETPTNGSRSTSNGKGVKVAKELIFLVEESPEGGYEARSLGESIYTDGNTLEELREAVADAVRCHFEEKDQPHLVRLHFVREEILSV